MGDKYRDNPLQRVYFPPGPAIIITEHSAMVGLNLLNISRFFIVFNLAKEKGDYLLNRHAIQMAYNVLFFKSRLLWTVDFRIKITFWRKNLQALNVDRVNP